MKGPRIVLESVSDILFSVKPAELTWKAWLFEFEKQRKTCNYLIKTEIGTVIMLVSIENPHLLLFLHNTVTSTELLVLHRLVQIQEDPAFKE